jgi:hypothetical protein
VELRNNLTVTVTVNGGRRSRLRNYLIVIMVVGNFMIYHDYRAAAATKDWAGHDTHEKTRQVIMMQVIMMITGPRPPLKTGHDTHEKTRPCKLS